MSTSPENSQESEILLAALELPVDQREEFLKVACIGREELKERILKLLQAAALDGSFMEKPILDVPPNMAPTIAPNEVDSVGTMIGPFKLLQVIGEGGMGTVYMAEQIHPVERRVALKIIKAGMDSRQVIARFEAERQALAMMDHPNIAKVLDAGTTTTGRPYFVMELVKGIPITTYCDDKKLTVRQRLELMVSVCNAIQHAHQKGIIHRDIKPGNILVAQYDGKPVPKVIDFGIAKATAQKLTEKSMFTEFGQVIGTLEYMSPEQAEMNQLDVDTRSDVYSLGVLLYELLTGTTPLDGKRMRSLAFMEMLRMIREDEPPRPSNRLSTLDTLPSVAANRQTEPARLSGLLRGELDWIVLMALDKDRNRRYESANGLAQDIQRYLQDEPVAACPPSSAYRFRKFAIRNKAILVAVALLALTLCVGMIGTGWQAIRAMRAEAKSNQENREKEAALKAALKSAELERVAREAESEQREKALQSEEDTRALSVFLVNDVLSTARPKGEQGGLGVDVKIRDAIDAAAERISETFRDRPNSEAIVRQAIGVTYRSIGEAQKAVEQLQKALEIRLQLLGSSDSATLDSRNSLAVAYSQLGMHDKALREHEAIVSSQRSKPGWENELLTFGFMRNLASAYHHNGQLDLAISLGEEVLKNQIRLSAPREEVLHAMSCLGASYVETGRFDEGFALLEDACEEGTELFESDESEMQDLVYYLARGYEAARQYEKALALHKKIFATRLHELGADHPATIMSQLHIGICYGRSGKSKEALGVLEECLKICTDKLGPEHPDTLEAMNALGVSLYSLERYEDAERVYTQLAPIARRVLGPNNKITLSAVYNLGMQYSKLGKHAAANELFEEALHMQRGEHWVIDLSSGLVTDSCYDPFGNFYLTGNLSAASNTPSNPNVSAIIGQFTFPLGKLTDIFVAKHNANGQFQWVARAGNPTTRTDFSRGIAVDAKGDVFVTGYFEGTAAFGSFSITSLGGQDGFIAKLDGRTGEFLWARQMGGNGKDICSGIEVDSAGNIIVTRGLNMSKDDISNAPELEIVKLDTNGETLWTQVTSGSMKGSLFSVGCDRDNAIYVGGRFHGSINSSDGNLVSTASIPSKRGFPTSNVLLGKLDPEGNWLWIKSMPGDTYTGIERLTVGPNNQLYVSGKLEGNANFGEKVIVAENKVDGFLASFDSTSGNCNWVHRFGNADMFSNVEVDSEGNLYVAGAFRGSAQFGTMTLNNEADASSCFVSKLSQNGTILEFRGVLYGAFSEGTLPSVRGLCIDSQGSAVICGPCYFGRAATTGKPIGTSINNGFVAKIPLAEDTTKEPNGAKK
jgi:serine/threonine protein kinase/tetratricopeptide (TPR) repeat protein